MRNLMAVLVFTLSLCLGGISFADNSSSNETGVTAPSGQTNEPSNENAASKKHPKKKHHRDEHKKKNKHKKTHKKEHKKNRVSS